MQLRSISNQNNNLSHKGYIKNTLALKKFKKSIDIVDLSDFYKKHQAMKTIKDGKEYTFKVEKVIINLDKQGLSKADNYAQVLKSFIVDNNGRELDFAYLTKPKEIMKAYTRVNDPIKQIDYKPAVAMFNRLFKRYGIN